MLAWCSLAVHVQARHAELELEIEMAHSHWRRRRDDYIEKVSEGPIDSGMGMCDDY